MTSALEQEIHEPSRADYDPLSSEAIKDPFSLFALVREESPVFFSTKLDWWVVSRYDDVAAVLGDPARFSAQGSVPLQPLPAGIADIAPEGLMDPNLPTGPGAHLRMRKLANQVFRPAKIEAREPEFCEIVDRLIDGFVDEGRTDVFANLAVPLPLVVIARVFGIPEADVGRLQHWSDNSFLVTTTKLDDDSLVKVWHTEIDYYRYIEDLIEERRASPRENDLATDLILARDAETPAFTTRELVKLIKGIVVAGNETTRMLIGSLILRLLENPEQLEAVREDPSLAGAAVEEALRHSGPAKGLFRTTTEDVELGGASIPKGQLVQILYASANRDEAAFEHPDEFDLRRADEAMHLGFGKGPHFCLGAALARVETRIALQQVLARLPGLRLATGDPPEWIPSIMAYGLTRLDVEWDIAPR